MKLTTIKGRRNIYMDRDLLLYAAISCVLNSRADLVIVYLPSRNGFMEMSSDLQGILMTAAQTLQP